MPRGTLASRFLGICIPEMEEFDHRSSDQLKLITDDEPGEMQRKDFSGSLPPRLYGATFVLSLCDQNTALEHGSWLQGRSLLVNATRTVGEMPFTVHRPTSTASSALYVDGYLLYLRRFDSLP